MLSQLKVTPRSAASLNNESNTQDEGGSILREHNRILKFLFIVLENPVFLGSLSMTKDLGWGTADGVGAQGD